VLAREGLLVPWGKRGFAVRSFTLEECRSAIRLKAILEGAAARSVAQRGLTTQQLSAFLECLRDGDAIFAKGRVVEGDEVLYGRMNAQFHGLIIDAAGNPLLAELLQRCNVVPFVSPATIAFDKNKLTQLFDYLSYAHKQHHAILDAMQLRDELRVEFLLREHAVTQEKSMNINGDALGLDPKNFF
jgi:GntR family transcriptional regulator of vanillate catabolism